MTKPQFKVSYRGKADYIFEGRRYSVRSFAHDDGHYNGDYYQTGIEPFVGCVSNDYAEGLDYFHEFPPAHVIEAFSEEHPGIVGAYYDSDKFAKVIYTAPRKTFWDETYKQVCADWMRTQRG